MIWRELAWIWLMRGVLGGTAVLVVGSLAARACTRPVRRARIVILTLLGCLIVPALATLPFAPRWSILIPSGPSWVEVPDLSPAGVASPARVVHGAPGPLPAGSAVGGSIPVAPRSSPSGATSGRPAVGGVGLFGPSLGPIPWFTVAVVAHLVGSVGLIAWWLAGQAALRRIVRDASPAPRGIWDCFRAISGPGGERVRLLESNNVATPLTFTWSRATIILPAGLGRDGDADGLRYALAHEWSHVEGRDHRTWCLASAAGLILFYQPLFWWLRGQLRLCQDYLADDRAAAIGSPEDYAAYLVRIARHVHGRPLPALGIGDGRSGLHLRINMLVRGDREPLEYRCRAAWSLASAAAAAIVIVAASGLHIAAGPVDDTPAPKAPKAAPAAPAPTVEGARSWKGRITEKGTGKPIAGADVTVEISVSRDRTTNEPRLLRKVRHRTGTDGAYEFTVAPEEAAERLLYITLIVEAPDHVGYFGGYGYGMLLKNEKLGERPFYENLELSPGRAVEGVVKTPEGGPAAGVKVQTFSTGSLERTFQDARWAETKTDARGRFRLVVHPKGKAVLWILPLEYAPETHGLRNDRRGDLGTFILERGIRISGRLLDIQGKPVSGVYVHADVESKSPGADDAVPPGVADMKHRATLTAADGSFTIRPLPPGPCRISTSEQGWDPSTREGAHDPPLRPLPAVFTPLKLTLKEGETPEPVEIRAVPHVVVEAQLTNSRGEKKSGHEIDLIGRIDGGFWSASCRSTADGAYRILAPHGLEDAQVTLVTNEHTALQFRTSKDAPLQHGRNIRLGTLDHDVRGIGIVRYEAPVILVRAVTKDGRPLKGFKASVDYTEPGPRRGGRSVLKGGGLSDVHLEEQTDGRLRTSQLVPDREVTVTVNADGFAPAGRTLKLPEGKTEEVALVLEPK